VSELVLPALVKFKEFKGRSHRPRLPILACSVAVGCILIVGCSLPPQPAME